MLNILIPWLGDDFPFLSSRSTPLKASEVANCYQKREIGVQRCKQSLVCEDLCCSTPMTPRAKLLTPVRTGLYLVSYKLSARSVHITQYIMEPNVWSDVWNIFKYHWLQQSWAGCAQDPREKLHYNTPHTYEAAVSHTRRSQLIHSFRSDVLKGTRNAWIKESQNSFKDNFR